MNIILSTIPNSGVFRPKEAKGRTDWLVFTNKALQARGDLTADQKKFATGANIQVQGLRDEVQQLKKELQSLRNPRQPGLYGYPQYQYGQIPPYQQPTYPPPQQGAYPYYPSTTSVWVSSATSTVLSSSKATNSKS